MDFHRPTNSAETLATVERLCRHHDHLKALVREYNFMRQEQTYGHMIDPTFRTDAMAMAQIDSRQWLRTSLVVKLPTVPLVPLFAEVTEIYADLSALIHRYYPSCEIDRYVDSAHITVKTIAGDCSQNSNDLNGYLSIIQPIVRHWLKRLGDETILYAVGLFSSLSKERGLSVGLRFYPSLPLLQIIRGAVGVALYRQASQLTLRPENAFHTMLIHSSGFRARLTQFPLNRTFVQEFRTLVEQYDHTVFGVITELTAGDFVIRHGYTDQLIAIAEVSCG